MKNRGAKIKQILELARHSGIVSSGEVRSHGIHHEYLRQLCTVGKLVRGNLGTYLAFKLAAEVHARQRGQDLNATS